MNIQDIKAIIMAGGKGTRLMPLTKNIPKPLMPVLAKPVIFYIIELLLRYNIDNIALTLMHMPKKIIDAVNNYFPMRFKYFIERKALGTAGSVKAAQAWLNKNPFIVISGDALTNLDLAKIYDAHLKSNADITMAVKEVENPSLYGVVKTDKYGYVTEFVEKPQKKEIISNLINCGIYIINPDILTYIPKDIPFDFARDLFPIILAQGKKIFAHRINKYWCDIGCIEEYFKANMDTLKGVKGLDYFTKNSPELYDIALRRTYLGKRSFLGLNVDVGNNVIIGNNCYIDGNISLSDCIIFDNTFLDVSCHGAIATPEHYIPVLYKQPQYSQTQQKAQTALNDTF
ncbi:MAG TPA: NDP-sugar synthase [Clostridiales bacterium]|nr:NDP-sugar synthase [Clostridiales bacterium]